jgi:hypothetical protein
MSGPNPHRCPCLLLFICFNSDSLSAGRSSPSLPPQANMSINSVPADILLDIADHLTSPAEVLHLYLTVCTYSIIHMAVTHSKISRCLCSRRRSQTRSPQLSIRSLRSAVQPNASIHSTCSSPDPTAHDTSVLSASAQTSQVADGHPSGVVARCRADTWCLLRCGVRRRTWRSCVRLRGTERSCPHTTTCGSRSVSRACVPLWFTPSFAEIEICSCPRLKYISTSLGSILPPPNSHVRQSPYLSQSTHTNLLRQLFDFSDLYGFSLTFKTGFYWQNDGVFRGSTAPQSHPSSRI